MPTESTILQFDAFISYRRLDGSGHAARLRQWLSKNTRLPPDVSTVREEPLEVYQDTAFERATDDFYAKEVRPALRASRHLIVVATPSAGGPSRWHQLGRARDRGLPVHQTDTAYLDCDRRGRAH